MANTSSLLTLRQAATLLKLSPDTLRVQVNRGALRAIKYGRDWLVDASEVARYKKEVARQ